MVLAGYTVVGEFHYVHHAAGGRRYDDPNLMGKALVSAAREAGIRITLLDTCYLAGGLTAGGHLPLDEVQQRFSDGTVEAWAERVARLTEDDDTVRIGAAVHSVRAVPRDDLAVVGEVAAQRRPPAARAPVGAARREPGLRGLLRVLAHRAARRRGAARPAHDAGARHPPVRRRHRGAGRRPGPPPASAPPPSATSPTASARPVGCTTPGPRSSLGSDQHAVIDPFEEVRGVEMHERLETLERGRFAGGDLLGDGEPQRLPVAGLGRRRPARRRPPRRPRRGAARQPAHGRVRARPGALRGDLGRRQRRRRGRRARRARRAAPGGRRRSPPARRHLGGARSDARNPQAAQRHPRPCWSPASASS